MKNFLKKIILPTVDTIVAIEDVPEVGEARPEEFATVEALIGFAKNDQKQRGLKLNDNILIQVCYISILKTISIIDLITPPLKFPYYFNLRKLIREKFSAPSYQTKYASEPIIASIMRLTYSCCCCLLIRTQ